MKRSTKTIMVILSALVVGLGFTFGTRLEVNRQVAPMNVYFAATDVSAGTLVTEDMIFVREVPSSSVPPNALLNSEQIVGKYVKQGFSIPQNSFLFEDVLVTENEMPNSSVLKLKEGEYAFPLLVDLETSLGNGILPDTKVDISFRTTIEGANGEEKILYGPIASDVRVTSVKDSNASAVFNDEKNANDSNKSKTDTLSRLYTFAVSSELEELLSTAVKLGEVRPIAKGESEIAGEDAAVVQNEIVKFIMDNSVGTTGVKGNVKGEKTANAEKALEKENND